MPLVPGLAMTNAARDILHGDYLSGGARAIEAFCVAAVVAVGVGMGMAIAKVCGFADTLILSFNLSVATIPRFFAATACSAIAVCGFSFLFEIQPKLMPVCAICGAISWAVYLIADSFGASGGWATFYATLAVVDSVVGKLSGMEFSLDNDDAIKAAEIANKVDSEFNACMDDDFNTALALSNLFGYFKDMKKLLAQGKSGDFFAALSYAAQIRKTYSILGLFKKNAKEYLAWYEEQNASAVPQEVQSIAEERWQARLNKDWAKSDELREKLSQMGYTVKDSKTGYELIKN
jgi:uncharacterized membrane protein YjjB (DUF3815 family)